MLLIPAIDLKDGKCVRLKQGKLEDSTIYSNKPFKVAEYFYSLGLKRIHVVDLNGAFKGKPENVEAIKEILKNKNLIIELGGGIRDLKTIEFYLSLGISYVIVGTAIVKDFQFVKEACKIFPNRIIAGVDAINGKVAINGWKTVTSVNVFELAKRLEDIGIREIIYTDISRDGMQTGINVEATVNLQKKVKIPIIASGGVKDIEDIKKLKENNVYGVITGRAIYEKTLDLKKAIEICNDD